MTEPTPQPTVADEEARRRIEHDLGATLFVEAGAGSGKTAALVGRVVALVTTGRAELAHIAAITFTEKAAAELRARIRAALQQVVRDHPDGEEGQRCRGALDQLDGAAIGTLHAFAQRILSENPVEAGLPPRLEVLDEVASDVAFEQRWSMFFDQLLTDPAMERTLLLLFAAGARPEALRVLARAFDDNWDLVAERVAPDAPEPPALRAGFDRARAEARELLDERCNNPDDGLRRRIEDIAGHFDRLSAATDEASLLEGLGPDAEPRLPSFRVTRTGTQGAWDDCDGVRARVAALGAQVEELRATVSDACAHRVGSAIRAFTLQAAAERRRTGQLQFHDLLVLARAVLRDRRHGPAVRFRLHQRYQHLLLDEFQDTDPIQIELAVRIAAADPEAAGPELDWLEVDVAPGRLFVVGDPKQSVYRFRRADVATFLAASARFGADGGRVELTSNFRSGIPVVDWVNATFSTLMDEAGGGLAASQPEYLPIHGLRHGAGAGPPVSVVGRVAHPREYRADQLRAAEAAEVAATVARVVEDGWTVDDGDGGWRPARLGDIAVLVPARTSLPFLEDALDELGIAFRAEASSLVYASRAVRDLLMVLRAVDDPTNHLHIVAALRTPLFACGDDDLFRFARQRGGRWSTLAPQPDTVPGDDPVRLGLEYLRQRYDERFWRSPSELLDRIARDRRAFELGFAEGRPRDVWRRLRFVIDQARAWSDATGGTLRQYLAWVAHQASEGARVAEAILPETDDDAVRIMTIHAAKGLEFPVTIVSGMSTLPQRQRAAAQVAFPPSGGAVYTFGRGVDSDEYEEWRPIDEQMALDERVRLLYVACTRARDHLVVSLHRKARKDAPGPASRTNAELLVEGMGERLGAIPDAAGATSSAPERVTSVPEACAAPAPFDTWLAERTAALARAAMPRAVAATALTDEGTLDAESEPDPGLAKRPRDLDLPPWLKGRYGTAVGRAVHGVLQAIDLATGAGLESAVAAQCEAEAVLERAEDVEELVRAALGSDAVRAAAAAEHWREVYVCVPVAERLLEGYVDLLYRSPDGLVVVDYKTAATADPDELDRRVEGYRNQGASYALAVAESTGERVVAVTFVFLTPDGARERRLDDLESSMAHVRSLVAGGQEVLAS